MSKTLEMQVPSCALVKKNSKDTGIEQPKLSDRYIVVCPRFFEDVLKQYLDRIDTYTLRDDEMKYRNDSEDQWSSYLSGAECYASVFITKDTGERLIYFPYQGKLFSCNDIIEAGKILEELRAREDLKIIP